MQIGALEGAYKQATGYLKSFSEQVFRLQNRDPIEDPKIQALISCVVDQATSLVLTALTFING